MAMTTEIVDLYYFLSFTKAVGIVCYSVLALSSTTGIVNSIIPSHCFSWEFWDLRSQNIRMAPDSNLCAMFGVFVLMHWFCSAMCKLLFDWLLYSFPLAHQSLFLWSNADIKKCNCQSLSVLFSYDCSNLIFGQTKNPLNHKKSPGGSSGGEGALIAGGGSLLGFGTDVAGSIRLPSSFCGLCGLKPTGSRLRSVLPSSLDR